MLYFELVWEIRVPCGLVINSKSGWFEITSFGELMQLPHGPFDIDFRFLEIQNDWVSGSCDHFVVNWPTKTDDSKILWSLSQIKWSALDAPGCQTVLSNCYKQKTTASIALKLGDKIWRHKSDVPLSLNLKSLIVSIPIPKINKLGFDISGNEIDKNGSLYGARLYRWLSRILGLSFEVNRKEIEKGLGRFLEAHGSYLNWSRYKSHLNLGHWFSNKR